MAGFLFALRNNPDPAGLVIAVRAIAYEKSGRWFTTEEPFLRAKERTDAGSSAFRQPRSELIAPLPQEVEPAFNNRNLHMRLPWREAKAALFEYIEIFYNRRRRHFGVHYGTPAQAHAEMLMKAAA